MTGDPISTVIGVFPDHDQVNGAIDELRHNKFGYDRIRVVEHGTGSFFDNLKGMFTGQSAVTSNTTDVLVKMGMPEYEAKYYQQELDANHVLLLMNADDRPEEAFSIMRQNGAFDINSRLRTPLTNGTTKTQHANGSQEVSNPDPALTTARPNVPSNAPQLDELPTTAHPDMPPTAPNQDAYPNGANSEVSQEMPQWS